MEQPSTSGARSDQFLRNVFLLKKGDLQVINGQIHMPTKSEIATLRARTEQYKRDVPLNTSMSSDMVKTKLEETFPYLKDKGFFCAAKRNVDNDTARFDFDGSPRGWNGRTIKKKIQGNSALYILENDQMDTSSGVSASDSESSQDVTEMFPWLRDNLHFDVECNPNYSPLQGGGPCVFTFTPGLPSRVTSVFAIFEGLDTQELDFSRRGWLGFLPASPIPQVVRVTLMSQDGIILGYTQVTYGTNLQQVVSHPSALKKLFEDLMSCDPYGNPSGNSGGETESFITLGCKKPAQMLSLLVYVAAEIGAQQFIEIIFTSSARRVVHNAYKCNLTLPETIARDHGYIETANYLADVTKRFSEETTTDNAECSQTIDWSELVKAAEASEKQLDLTNEKQNGEVETNDPKETGYLADADTSSSEASAPQSSDSEDDISNKTKTTATATTATRKGSVSGRECQIGLQKDLHREDGNADTEDPVAGNYRGRKETLHHFESRRRKKGEIWQQGDLHSERNRDTEDPIPGNYLDRKETLRQFESNSGKTGAIPPQGDLHRKDRYRDSDDSITGNYRDQKETFHEFESINGKTGEMWQQGDVQRKARSRDNEDSVADSHRDHKETVLEFEVEDIPSTSDFMKDVKRTKSKLQKQIRFSDLSKAEKQEDSKELEKLKVKANTVINKVKGTIKSLHNAAGKLDEVWESSKKAHAAASIGSIAGGLLAITGGIATAITGGAAAPLLIAGMGIGAAGAGANAVTTYKEASINSSEIEEAQTKLQDTNDSIDDVKNTIRVWLESKNEVRLLYICCLAELNPDKNDLVMKLLHMVVLHAIMLYANGLGQTGRVTLSAGLFRVDVAVRCGAKVAETAVGAIAAGQAASQAIMGVTGVLVVADAIDLGYTIKDLVEKKGSEAARSLRQKADELECFLKGLKNYLPVNF